MCLGKDRVMKSLCSICVLVVLALPLGGEAAESPAAAPAVISGTTGRPGVALRGFPGNVRTDAHGCYRVEVPHGWSGRVVPVRQGYTFDPPARQYERVTQNLFDQSYKVEAIVVTISGRVGVPDIRLQGFPDYVVSDANGAYTAKVNYEWSGRVVPIKEGYTFNPPQRRYRSVTMPMRNQDYVPAPAVVPSMMADDAGGLDVLVIPSRKVDPQAQVEVQEDMLVMLQILRDMLSEPRMILGILYDYGDIFAGGGQDTRAFYLEGYGALFVLEVDFPFLRAEPNSVEEEPERDVDPIWQRARQRLRGSGGGPAYNQRPSDEVSFEQLKADLIETLKHTANIRHVDPNEQIIFTIVSRPGRGSISGSSVGYFSATGGGWGAGSSYSYSVGGFSSGGGSEGRVPQLDQYGQPKRDALGNTMYQQAPTPPAQPVAAPGPTTVLTIRAKKSDVDVFAAGQVDLEQFQQRVTVFNY